MPFNTTYNPSALGPGDIGWQIMTTNPNNTIAVAAGTTVVMSMTIPSVGVWLVEGQVNCYVTSPTNSSAVYIYWSLSIISGNNDNNQRVNYIYTYGDNSNAPTTIGVPGNQMSSIFVVTDISSESGNNIIYMNATFPYGECATAANNKTYIRCTRIA
jgi:hypothetical protein